jgi:hypothetical protein
MRLRGCERKVNCTTLNEAYECVGGVLGCIMNRRVA